MLLHLYAQTVLWGLETLPTERIFVCRDWFSVYSPVYVPQAEKYDSCIS